MTSIPASPVQGRRVCVLARNNPIVEPAGNAEYLARMADLLGLLGAEVHLIILDPVHYGAIKSPLDRRYLASFADVHGEGATRSGDRLYTLRPAHLARWASDRLLRAARLKPPFSRTMAPWALPPAAPRSATYAARMVDRLKPALVLCNYVNAAELAPGLRHAAPCALLTHDVFALRLAAQEREGMVPDFDVGLLAREPAAFAAVDLVIAIQEIEARHIRSVADTPTVVIPHLMEPDPLPHAPGPAPVCLFVGSDNWPNRDGLAWLLRSVWPQVRAARPDARLRVIGRAAGTWDGPPPPGVTLAGFVDDLRAEYAAAALAVTPLRYGSGLKIKTVEALAYGVPMVATSVGAEGVTNAPSEALTVADGDVAFAQAIAARMDAGPEARAAGAARCAAVVAESFSAGAAAARLAEALRAVAAARAASGLPV